MTKAEDVSRVILETDIIGLGCGQKGTGGNTDFDLSSDMQNSWKTAFPFL